MHSGLYDSLIPYANYFVFKGCPSNAEPHNLSRVTEFHLMELSEDPELQPILLVLFLSMYLVTVLGNLLIILAVSSDSHLHTPMYFFLCNLSLADIGLISTTVPKMIVDIHIQSKVISYVGCLTQMSLLFIFACMDDLLLTVMAYDRFVAICHPLRYSVIMNPHHCVFLVLTSFVLSILGSLLHDSLTLQYPYFKDFKISNFFCDPSQILNLVCSDVLTKNILSYFVFASFGSLPVSGIIFSYYKIVFTILQVPTSGGKYKAFSTCGSHLCVVCLFYGTGLGVYLSSAFSQSPRSGALASLIYAIVTPMLNPFIYGLRNRDIKDTIQRLHGRKV